VKNLEFEKISDRSISKSVVLMTMSAVLLISFAGSLFLLQAKGYDSPARPDVIEASSAGPDSPCAFVTGSVVTICNNNLGLDSSCVVVTGSVTTICNFNVPSTDPQTIAAKVTTYGAAGNQMVSVANINGVTPSSVALETGKLNQQFR
jgi:hypothetical protein